MQSARTALTPRERGMGIHGMLVAVCFLSAAAFFLYLAGTASRNEDHLFARTESLDAASAERAVIETTLGTIEINFLRSEAPQTVRNFITLAESGFYDSTKIHRIVRGSFIQAGDPNSKNADRATYGSGGPGHTVPREKGGLHMTEGAVAAVPSGRASHGSQFIIVTGSAAQELGTSHIVFGRVTSGMSVLKRASDFPVDGRGVPLNDITVKRIVIR